MSLSKAAEISNQLAIFYLSNLYINPVKTKAITSCLLAICGNYIGQKVMGVRNIHQDSLIAFGLVGLLFGGPLPHYFYANIHKLTKNSLGILVLERLLYTPLFQALSLYMLSRFEGKTHVDSYNNLQKLYWPILSANLKYLTLLQFINIRYVPPILRVLVVNLIGLLWTIYLAKARAESAKKRKN